MKETILLKLKEIEEKEDVKIIYAVESGSRAWGFESDDSDYDVRFIYVRKIKDYLSMFPKKDTIHFELNNIYDINGWDLQKALKLLYQSNPTLYEWNHSPIIYKRTSEWESIQPAFEYYFQIQKALHHYYHMSITTYQKPKTLKRYLYTLRTILSCLWVIEKGTPPPIQLEILVQEQLIHELKAYVLSLIEQKRTQKENDSFQESPELNNYIEKQFQFIKPYLIHEKTNLDYHLLNEIFLNILNI